MVISMVTGASSFAVTTLATAGVVVDVVHDGPSDPGTMPGAWSGRGRGRGRGKVGEAMNCRDVQGKSGEVRWGSGNAIEIVTSREAIVCCNG